MGGLTTETLPVLEKRLPAGDSEGDDPLLGPLSHGLEVLCLDVDVPVLETGHFRYPESRIQHDGHQCRISGSQGRPGVDGVQDPVDLLPVEGFDDQVGRLGLFEILKDVLIGVALPVQPSEEGPEGVHPVVHGVGGHGLGFGARFFLKEEDEPSDHHLVDVLQCRGRTPAFQPVAELAQYQVVPLNGSGGFTLGPVVDLEVFHEHG